MIVKVKRSRRAKAHTRNLANRPGFKMIGGKAYRVQSRSSLKELDKRISELSKGVYPLDSHEKANIESYMHDHISMYDNPRPNHAAQYAVDRMKSDHGVARLPKGMAKKIREHVKDKYVSMHSDIRGGGHDS